MVTGVPLALGSWWGLLILVITLPVLAWRILDEEKLLAKDLPGYAEYEHKVRFRLVPYVWLKDQEKESQDERTIQ